MVAHVEPHQHPQQNVLSKVTMAYMFVEQMERPMIINGMLIVGNYKITLNKLYMIIVFFLSTETFWINIIRKQRY